MSLRYYIAAKVFRVYKTNSTAGAKNFTAFCTISHKGRISLEVRGKCRHHYSANFVAVSSTPPPPPITYVISGIKKAGIPSPFLHSLS